MGPSWRNRRRSCSSSSAGCAACHDDPAGKWRQLSLVFALRDDQKALLEHDSGGEDQSGKEYHRHYTELDHNA